MEAIIRELVDFLTEHKDAVISRWMNTLFQNPADQEATPADSQEKYRQMMYGEVWPHFLDHLKANSSDYHDRLLDWAREGFQQGISCDMMCESHLVFQRSMVEVLLYDYKGMKESLAEMIRLLEQEVQDHMMRTLRDYMAIEQKARKESEQQYRHVIENVTDMIYMIDDRGQFTFYNKAAVEILGYGERELIGHHFREVLTESSTLKALDHFRRAMNAEEPFSSYRLDMLTKEGRMVSVEIRTKTIYRRGLPVGRIGIARDITARRRFERELRAQRDWFSTILHSLPETIMVYDEDYNIVFTNEKIDNGKSRKCYEFIEDIPVPCPEAGLEYPCTVHRVIHEGIPGLDYIRDYPDKRLRLQSAPITNPDGRRGAVEIILNETKQREFERIKQELHETINQLNALQLTKTFGSSLDIQEIGKTVIGQLKKVLPLNKLMLCVWNSGDHGCYIFAPDLSVMAVDHDGQKGSPPELRQVFDQQKGISWKDGEDMRIALPLIHNGESVGVWCVNIPLNHYAPFHDEILSTISDHVSLAIGHSLLFLAERRERTAREGLVAHAERLTTVAELASIISHEIRNPLSAIESAAEMLQGAEELEAEDKELLRIVKLEAKRVNQILNTYLQYARMSAPRIVDTNIHELITEIVQLIRPGIPSEIETELDLSAGVDTLPVDPGQFRQAFLNLARNAIEAMSGEGKLAISTWVEDEPENFCISFADTGK